MSASEDFNESLRNIKLDTTTPVGEDENNYGNYDTWSAMRKNSPMNVRDRLRAEQRTNLSNREDK